jgi:A/G-specific adenine glycosylase
MLMTGTGGVASQFRGEADISSMIDPAVHVAEHAGRLLAWYDRHRRRLPWRALPDAPVDPYAVWLSEIMLQQTTTVTVGPYFEEFLARWPSVADLAAAPLDDVLRVWAGLGYYARARNLHACARAVVAEHGGRFPDTEDGLRRLPGIGAYTAAAVAAIAFDRPAAVMDGNIERVLARLFAIATPLPDAKPELRRRATVLTPVDRPGDYAQAMMDLGATLCTPRKPACALCPLTELCATRRAGNPEDYPARRAKPERPLRRGVAFWTLRADGAVLLRRRPDKGLLGGMIEVPSTAWIAAPIDLAAARAAAPVAAPWRVLDGQVSHGFTHFQLELIVLAATVQRGDPQLGIWCPLDRVGEQALPTLFRKVVRHALRHA